MNEYGFVRVCAATPEIRVADVRFNANNILSAAKEAAEKGAQVIVFPELCVTGYTCGDLFNQRALIAAAEEALFMACRKSSRRAADICGRASR